MICLLFYNIADHNTTDLNTTWLSTITKRKMTQRQKIKYFQSDEGGGNVIDNISSPKIRAISQVSQAAPLFPSVCKELGP